MKLLRKLKTAASVLRHYGLRETLGLLHDNIYLFFTLTQHRALRLWHATLGRLTARLPRHPGVPRILYVTTKFEAFHSQTVRYRVHNFRQALRGRASTRFELIGEVHSAEWADLVVLMRVTWTPAVEELLRRAEEHGVPTVFDIDDIVFLPEYAAHYCAALGETGQDELEKRQGEFRGFEKTFRRCGCATASTPYIARIMEGEGKRAFVIHNGLNRRQLRIARAAVKRPKEERTVGYMSGTKTHDRDFAQAAPALAHILREYPDARLNVAGYLDLAALPRDVAARAVPAPYMHWTRLMRYGARNAVNIAPLDTQNPFCHAKSELKYFEAAAVGVPTVASPTDTFARCIKDGENGMLAADEEEWYRALRRLFDDRALYERMARRAYDDALRNYGPEATAGEALAAYAAVLGQRAP